MNIKNRSVQMNNSKRCLFFIIVFGCLPFVS